MGRTLKHFGKLDFLEAAVKKNVDRLWVDTCGLDWWKPVFDITGFRMTHSNRMEGRNGHSVTGNRDFPLVYSN